MELATTVGNKKARSFFKNQTGRHQAGQYFAKIDVNTVVTLWFWYLTMDTIQYMKVETELQKAELTHAGKVRMHWNC